MASLPDDGGTNRQGSTFLGCVARLLLFGGLSIACRRILGHQGQHEQAYWALAAVCAGFLTAGLNAFARILLGDSRRAKERVAALMSRARSGETPQDGQPVIATGMVRALEPLLTAPLSGAPCVQYEYCMYYTVPSGDDETRVPVYWGFARSAFILDSPVERIRIRGVLEPPKRSLRGEDVSERARRYVSETSFQPSDSRRNPAAVVGTILGKGFAARRKGRAFIDGLLDQARESNQEIGSDREGRRDFRSESDEREPGSLQFVEAFLPAETEVSIFGRWSAELAAVTGSMDGIDTCLVFGPPKKLSDKGPDELATGRSDYVAALLLPLIGAGLLWVGTTLDW